MGINCKNQLYMNDLPDQSHRSATPRIAIVIPLFKQSGLVWEALASALDQDNENRYGIVLVNDGCPYTSSHQAGLAAAAASPVPFLYIRQINQGLSGARNTGIEAALDAWPCVEAIYLLDADNRLSPHSIHNMLEALETHPEADWFYPDIKMIGLNSICSMQGRYNTALHAELNICEAGSLIRRRIFDAGVRYDEAMKSGYEDWEFWFSAIDAGFVNGQHLPAIDFRYRQRPESMLKDSTRLDHEIRSYMLSKHPWLDNPKDLNRTGDDDPEAKFALITPEGACYLNEARSNFVTFPIDRLKEDFYRWRIKPGAYGFPGKVIFSTWKALSVLETESLLPWAYWDLEQRLENGADVASLQLEQDRSEGLLFGMDETLSTGSDYQPSVITMLSSELLSKISRDSSTEWFTSICTSQPELKHSIRKIHTGSDETERAEDSAALAASFGSQIFDPDYNSGESEYWTPLDSGPKNRKGRVRSFDPEREGSVQIARPSAPERAQVAFVLPSDSSDDVARTAYQIAHEFLNSKCDCHLVCLGDGEVHIPDDFRPAFKTISWYNFKKPPQLSRGPYLGTFLASEPDQNERNSMLSLFEGIDVAINFQSSDFHNLAGYLKRSGTVSLSYQHILAFSDMGQPVGHSVQSLAFEYAYAAILTCSQQLAGWFRQNGLPEEKLETIRSGPSILMTEIDLDRAAEKLARRDPAKEMQRPLRALYLGPLEPSKGLDRLTDLIGRTQNSSIDWRIIGKGSESEKHIHRLQSASIEIEPHHRDADIRKALEWADILIHPHHHEEIPLTIVDAMSNGVLAIATDVEALREVLDNKRTGFLLPEATFVTEAESILLDLNSDRWKLRNLASTALEQARALQWQYSTTRLQKRIAQLIATQTRQKKASKAVR